MPFKPMKAAETRVDAINHDIKGILSFAIDIDVNFEYRTCCIFAMGIAHSQCEELKELLKKIHVVERIEVVTPETAMVMKIELSCPFGLPLPAFRRVLLAMLEGLTILGFRPTLTEKGKYLDLGS